MQNTSSSREEEYFTTRQVARLLKVTPETVIKWRYLNRGPAYEKLSSSPRSEVRYRLADIRAWQATRPRVVPAMESNVEAAYERL